MYYVKFYQITWYNANPQSIHPKMAFHLVLNKVLLMAHRVLYLIIILGFKLFLSIIQYLIGAIMKPREMYALGRIVGILSQD